MQADGKAVRQRLDPVTRFLRVAREVPHRSAVCDAGVTLSFAELEERTERLASVLRSRGVGLGNRVGVSLPRQVDLIIALLAVWRTGAAYVPLDPSYPEGRLTFMVTDAGVTSVISSDESPGWAGDADIVAPDSPGHVSKLDVGVNGSAPAYVMYTSGSTGQPKGVEVTRGGVASLVAALELSGVYPGRHSVVGWNASMSFDASVQQWVRVCRGDTVVILDDAHRTDPRSLRSLLDKYEVTDLDLTPTHWDILRAALLAPSGAGVRRLFVGGEPIPRRTWRELAEESAVEALNLYGPTECTVDATAAWVAGTEVNLGRTLPDGEAYVLDAWLRPVPPAVTGELYLAGPRLAVGYVNRPSLTAERFVANPFTGDGARMYRTGDLVRRSEDGVLTFVGRSDRQVKLRGFRIELEEIEQVLDVHPDVARAVVLLRSERLVAYVLPAGDRPLVAERLVEHLAETLPEFMVPLDFVRADKLPMTPNGKVDAAALPEPPSDPVPYGSLEPTELIRAIWAEVLGRQSIGPDDDFFALGGQSRMVIEVAARLKAALGVTIRTRELYRYRQLRELAAYVGSVSEGEGD